MFFLGITTEEEVAKIYVAQWCKEFPEINQLPDLSSDIFGASMCPIVVCPIEGVGAGDVIYIFSSTEPPLSPLWMCHLEGVGGVLIMIYAVHAIVSGRWSLGTGRRQGGGGAGGALMVAHTAYFEFELAQ